MDLKKLLERLRSYVQSIADANPESAVAIIESAGMSVKGKGGRHAQVFGAQLGDRLGEVILSAPKAGDRAAYEWAYSIDGMKTWIPLLGTMQTKTTVTGLPSGVTVYFQHRTITPEGVSDWSEPISIRMP
jgi:hypothetical protein